MANSNQKTQNPADRAKDFKGSFFKLIRYLGKFKWSIFLVFFFSIFSAVFSIVGPRILGQATTTLFTQLQQILMGQKQSMDFSPIADILFVAALLYVISGVFQWLQGFLMANVSSKVTYSMRRDIVDKISKLPFQYFDTHSYGDVLSRITNDIDTIFQNLNQSISQIVTSITSIIGILIMMFLISWEMTLVALIVLPISGFLMLQIVKRSQKYFVTQQNALGQVNGHIEEMYGSHIVVKSFNGEEESIECFQKYNDTLYQSAWKSQFFSSLTQPVMNLVSNLAYVVICILGGYLAFHGGIAVGDIQSFIQYMRNFTQPIIQIANISNVLQQTVAASERVFTFLEETEETPDLKESSIPVDQLKGSVSFSHVSFGYDPEKLVIHDFSALVESNKTIALVGPTGAGKTTLVKLLMRFYDVTDGAILIDQSDIRQLKRNDLRSLFGMVLQDTWLYHSTIRENIRFGRLNATDEEVEAAAKMAQADHFIQTLPGGYDMIINEESSNISQGQKQLLTIARAILANPKIMILDEATSSVDTRTEILIQKAMANLMKNRTSFIIAHRLSTIKNADMIFVINNGDIVESGTHASLLSKNGFYSQLYNSQFDLEA